MQRPPPVRLPRGIFYGWVIVGVALLTNVAATPLNPLIFSFFVGPMSDETGWARSAIALALSIRLLAAAISTPFLGAFLDRHGARWLASGSGLAVLFVMLLLAAFPSLPMLYIAFAVVGAVGLGAPGGSVMTQVPPAKWFVAKRGRALAIATVGLPGGAVAMIPVATFLLDRFGWQAAYGIFGVAIALAIVPANALLMRRTPEDHGLLPDGAPARERLADPDSFVEEPPDKSWSVREAARTSAFWVSVTAFVLSGFALSGIVVHRVAYWEDTGLAPALVAVGIAVDPLTVVASTLAWGWAAERLPSRLLGAVAGGGFALSMVPMVLTSGQPFTIFLYSLPWGIAAGAWITLNNELWAEYFGRGSLGAIRGAVLPGTLAAAAAGPVTFGLLLDAGVDARAVWTFALFVFVVVGLLLFSTRAPAGQPGRSGDGLSAPSGSG